MNKKKIGLIGNMNNNHFVLARYLRDYGYEVKLFLLRNEPQIFHPSMDTFSDEYKEYVKPIEWSTFPSDFMRMSRESIRKEIEGLDVLIGHGPAPAYLNKIGKRLDFFIPYGSDLVGQPFIGQRALKRLKKLPKQIYYAWNQKKGIEKSKYIVYEYTNEGYEKVFTKFRLSGERLNFWIPLLYHPEYADIDLNKIQSIHAGSFKKIRESHDFVVFHHCGHIWHPETQKKCYTVYADKGNDKVIEGFHKFLNETGANACLIMLEYDVDVENSKKLVNSLGIQDHVAWFPVMPRKEIMIGLQSCDVGVGEIKYPWITYGTVLEIIASGKPVIMNRNEKIKELYPEQYAHWQAASAEEVYLGLVHYYKHPEKAKSDGEIGKKWYTRYIAQQNIERLVSLF